MAVIWDARYVAASALIFENLLKFAIVLKSTDNGALFTFIVIQGCLYTSYIDILYEAGLKIFFNRSLRSKLTSDISGTKSLYALLVNDILFFSIFLSIYLSDYPSKGGTPVTSIYNITPIDQISHFSSYTPLITSGEM